VKKTHDYVHYYRENGRPGGHLPGADEFFNKLSVLVP